MKVALLTFKMTRREAEYMGLLTCGTCGHPSNNHWSMSEGCAHCKCKVYKEVARIGTLVKTRKKAK